LKFLIDMPVTPQAVARLQSQGHDAVHASDLALGSAPDIVLLDRARAEGRVVITADLDYPRLAALMKLDSPGIVLFRGGSLSDQQMLTLLDRVLARGDDLDLEHSIVVVDRQRIRRRPLPID
jgi:predicted nuclease of predicted toxin-antitoxin system